MNISLENLYVDNGAKRFTMITHVCVCNNNKIFLQDIK